MKMTAVSKEKMNEAIQEIKTCYQNNKILSKCIEDLDFNDYIAHITLKLKVIHPIEFKEMLNLNSQLKLSELFCIGPNDYTSLVIDYKVKEVTP
jgi:hypothetical protein